jgi:hypothetical protein
MQRSQVASNWLEGLGIDVASEECRAPFSNKGWTLSFSVYKKRGTVSFAKKEARCHLQKKRHGVICKKRGTVSFALLP